MLLAHVKSYLEKNSNAVSEYQLLEQLRHSPSLIEIEQSCQQQPALQLFRKHFTVMNALYRLQREYQRQGKYYLEVSALRIALHSALQPPPSESAGTATIIHQHADRALVDYYLNWDHYLNTTENNVQQLLSDFWIAFSHPEKKLAAYQLLDLKVGSAFIHVEKRYRRLAAKHHPDRGGNSEDFIRIREAYEVLKTYKPNL